MSGGAGKPGLAEKCRSIPGPIGEPHDASEAYALMTNGSFGTISECIRSCAMANAYFSRIKFDGEPGGNGSALADQVITLLKRKEEK